jgi:hypothetical protein
MARDQPITPLLNLPFRVCLDDELLTPAG